MIMRVDFNFMFDIFFNGYSEIEIIDMVNCDDNEHAIANMFTDFLEYNDVYLRKKYGDKLLDSEFNVLFRNTKYLKYILNIDKVRVLGYNNYIYILK